MVYTTGLTILQSRNYNLNEGCFNWILFVGKSYCCSNCYTLVSCLGLLGKTIFRVRCSLFFVWVRVGRLGFINPIHKIEILLHVNLSI